MYSRHCRRISRGLFLLVFAFHAYHSLALAEGAEAVTMDKTQRVRDAIGEITASVVFIRTAEGQPSGTAFIVGYPGRNPTRVIPLLVTARHVVDGQAKILVRFNGTDAGNRQCTESSWVLFDLAEARRTGELWTHPDPDVDVAIFRISPNRGAFRWVPVAFLASRRVYDKAGIKASDRIVFPSLLPASPGLARDHPVVRDGSIALVPPEGLLLTEPDGTAKQRDLILINGAANQGSSGAPVYLWDGRRPGNSRGAPGGTPYVVGLVQGFFSSVPRDVVATDSVTGAPVVPVVTGDKKGHPMRLTFAEDSNIGTVVPSWLILKTLESPQLRERMRSLEAHETDR
jgi:hypothetical protein